MSESVILSRPKGSISSSSDQWLHPMSHNAGAFAARVNAEGIMPTPGKIKSLRGELKTAPGGTKVRWIILWVNGSATSLKIRFRADQVISKDVTNVITVAAGDKVVWKSEPVDTPAVSDISFSWIFDGDVAGESILMTGVGGSWGNTTHYLTPQGNNDNQELTLIHGESLMAGPFTVKKLYVDTSNDPGVGKSRTFTMMLNGSTTALTCTVSGATETDCNDTTHSFTVVAGDAITHRHTTDVTAGAYSAKISCVLLAATDGQFMICKTTNKALPVQPISNGADVIGYDLASGGAGQFSTTEGDTDNICNSFTAKEIYVESHTAARSNRTWQMDLRLNGTDSALTCTIPNSGTTCNHATDVVVADDDLINWKITHAGSGFGTQSSAGCKWGILGFIEPSGPDPTVLTPDPVVVSLAVPAVTIGLGALTIAPDAVAAVVAVVAPTVVLGGLTISPDPVTVLLTVPPVTIQAVLTIKPVPVAVSIAVPDPNILLGPLALTPDPVVVQLVIPAPSVQKVLRVLPDPVTVSLSVPDPRILKSLSLLPDPVTVDLLVPTPAVLRIVLDRIKAVLCIERSVEVDLAMADTVKVDLEITQSVAQDLNLTQSVDEDLILQKIVKIDLNVTQLVAETLER